MNKFSYSDLAGAIIFVAFKIIEQLEKDFPINDKVNHYLFIIYVIFFRSLKPSKSSG